MTDGSVLVAAATPRELGAAPRDWSGADDSVAGSGLLRDGDDYGLVTGVGPADAATRVTAALERFDVDAVVSIGVAGALPGGGLDVGDAVVGTEATQGDLGRRGPDGFEALDAMGIEGASAGPYPLVDVDAAPGAARGTVASVATVSATDDRAARIAERTGAVAETMETAAVARVGGIYGVPVGAVAGIANRAATDRGFDAAAGLDALRDALAESDLEVSP